MVRPLLLRRTALEPPIMIKGRFGVNHGLLASASFVV